MKLILDNITLDPGEGQEKISEKIRDRWGIDVSSFTIVRKSLDARKKRKIVYRFRVMIEVDDKWSSDLVGEEDITEYIPREIPAIVTNMRDEPVHIVGSGPAGLFCALRLIEAGVRVEIFERGRPVEERMRDIAGLERKGILDERSNVLFGEGGAGTYSDGKLTARTRRPEVDWFFKELIEAGAPSSILYEAKPHLGTDRLGRIVAFLRKKIIEAGSEIHFNESLEDLVVRQGRIEGAITSKGREVAVSRLVLAAGHSARDTYAMLEDRGVAIEGKGFAVGVRIEHPAALINEIQYGSSPFRDLLPPADYFLTSRGTDAGRSVYSFCMCPGGRVINTSSEKERLCVNGMSFSDRGLPFSNAALVVTVTPGDWGGAASGGISFQRSLEESAFMIGGGGFIAPAQRVTDFLKDSVGTELPETSYLPGVKSAALHHDLPVWIVRELKHALRQFEKKMRGFITESALLIGTETRTSSPVRIIRNEGFQSISHGGLYPVGEGAGYAGGIVSSAVDGIRCADIIALGG